MLLDFQGDLFIQSVCQFQQWDKLKLFTVQMLGIYCLWLVSDIIIIIIVFYNLFHTALATGKVSVIVPVSVSVALVLPVLVTVIVGVAIYMKRKHKKVLHLYKL